MMRIVLFLAVFIFVPDISAASPRTPPFFKTATSLRTTSSSRTTESRTTASSLWTTSFSRTTSSTTNALPSRSTAFSTDSFPSVPLLVPVQHPPSPKTTSFQKNTLSPKPLVPFKTAASSTTVTFPQRKGTTETVFRIPRRLQVFNERLQKRCDFTGLDAAYTDLKAVWAKAMEGENEQLTIGIRDAQKFVKKLVEHYNKCVREEENYENIEVEWDRYTKIFGKEYAAGEKAIRKEIFKKSKENVEMHNKLYRNGKVTYNASFNQFSDWTAEELERANGFQPPNGTRQGDSGRVARFVANQPFLKHYYYNPFLVRFMPVSVDWRTRGYVTAVKNQGTCGSCYAMSALGALEAYHKKRTGNLVILSTQNILDCTWFLGNTGCHGGHHDTVFLYAVTTGIVLNSRYPYTMNASHNCRWKREHAVATDKGYFFVEEGNELALRNAVANYGPVSVALGQNGLHAYDSGIFNTEDCGPVTHTVLVVGYGTDPVHGDYWIIKNSWGFWWGEDGYYRMARNRNNMCQIATHAYFPF